MFASWRRFLSTSVSPNPQNNSLLEAFTLIIKAPSTTPTQTTLSNVFKAHELRRITPAPQFNVEEGSNSNTQDFWSKNFQPGDVILPEDLINARMHTNSGPTQVKKKVRIDSFNRTKYDLYRAHLNTSMLANCMTATGRIMSRKQTGLSLKTQRNIAKAIKRARHMGTDCDFGIVNATWAYMTRSWCLEVRKNGMIIQDIFLSNFSGNIVLGRSPDSDIILDHASISRNHAYLFIKNDEDQLYICDLDSTHGTFVAGIRIQAKVEIHLPIDSRIVFGASSREYFVRQKEEASPGLSSESDNLLFGNPIKTLQTWFEQAAGEKLCFETTPSGSHEKHRLILKLPIATREGSEEVLIEARGDSRADAERAVALLACQKLYQLGMLEPTAEDSSWMGWKRAKEEMLAEEEVLIMENKRSRQDTKITKIDEIDIQQLMTKREDLFEQLMAFDEPEDDDLDEVDLYMKSLTATEKEKILKELEEIDTLINKSNK